MYYFTNESERYQYHPIVFTVAIEVGNGNIITINFANPFSCAACNDLVGSQVAGECTFI